jgi:hypothetical protein
VPDVLSDCLARRWHVAVLERIGGELNKSRQSAKFSKKKMQ